MNSNLTILKTNIKKYAQWIFPIPATLPSNHNLAKDAVVSTRVLDYVRPFCPASPFIEAVLQLPRIEQKL